MFIQKKTMADDGRRLFLRGLAGLSLGGLIIPGMAHSKPKLSAQYGVASIDPSYALIYVALKNGYFTDSGIEVSYLNSQSGPRTKQMVAAGQITIGTSGVSDAIALTVAGKQCVLIGCLDRRVAYANIMIGKKLWDKGIRELKQLDGLSLGVTQPQAGTWLMAVYITDKAGLKDKVKIKPMGDYATMAGAVKTGALDCTMATIGMLGDGQQQGWGVPLFDATDDASWNSVFGGNVPGYGCYVMQEEIERRPEAVQALANGLAKASKFLEKATPDEIADAIFDSYLKGFSRTATIEAFKAYKKTWSYTNVITKPDYERLISIMSGRQYSASDLAKAPYDREVNMSFLKKAGVGA